MTAPRYRAVVRREDGAAHFELAGPAQALLAGLAAAHLPVPKSPKAIAEDGAGARVAWIGPRRMTVSAPADRGAAVAADLELACREHANVLVADVSGAVVSFLIDGPGAVDVLAQGVPHDLGASAFLPGTVLATDAWGMAVQISHAGTALRVGVEASWAGYLEAWLATASGIATSIAPGTMQRPPASIRP